MLTEEQKNALRNIMADYGNFPYVTLGGYAGTGKSTILKVLLEAFERKGLSFAAAAYTGKACNVLRKKGIPARTIHSTIYTPVKDADTDETIWILKTHNDMILDGVHGFIIDEASMVSKEIHEDLLSFRLPIIYVGDHGQLEPIGTKFNLMENPMHRLETVHRNAGEIAHFAEHLRKGRPAFQFQGGQKVQITSESAIEDRHLAAVDQVIVAFNKTRVSVNQRIRKEKGIEYTFIAEGEKIICLRNHRTLGLFNGMQGIVTKVRKRDRFDFISDGLEYENIKYDPDQFGQETNKFEFKQEANPFDYGYAVTCHKAQGDQFGNIIVFEQECNKWDHIRWSYTAASRAVNGIIWLKSGRYTPSYLS
jgi:exodeoxyribonuclease-5